MAGNIYARQKCWICKGPLRHDDRRRGCFCDDHPEVQATKGFIVRFGKKISLSFPTYDQAYQHLMGLRYEKAGGKLDVRDHMASNPLGFANVANEYLKFKEKLGMASFWHVKRYMTHAIDFFQGTNIKEIRKKDIRAFLESLVRTTVDKKGNTVPVIKKDKFGKEKTIPLADKTKANYCSQLHDFFYNYVYEEEELIGLHQLPKFPKVEYELGFRKIIDIETREKIVDKIKEDTYTTNPKIWLGIDMACSYAKIRPIDLRRLREGDIDLDYGFATFWRPSKSKKRKKPKVVGIKLLDYHIEEIQKCQQMYPGIEETIFFRHTPTNSRQPNEPFGKDYLYRAWKKACAEFDIYNLDLYGGTRHSSVTAIGKIMGKDRARDFSGHDTNEAFDRYCQIGAQDDFDISEMMASVRSKGKVVPFPKKKATK